MQITLIAIGHKIPAWAQSATNEYLNRLPPEWHVTVKTPRAVDNASAPIERVLATEGERILAAVPDDATLVALDERGKDLATDAFARQLARWRDDSAAVAFAIGGANGLAPEVKSRARLLLRLSSLTLPHALARVLLAEQLYRAWSLLAGHPYHRA